MPEAILYFDRSTIRSDDIMGLKDAVASLANFVREREPQLLFYGVEIDVFGSKETICRPGPRYWITLLMASPPPHATILSKYCGR